MLKSFAAVAFACAVMFGANAEARDYTVALTYAAPAGVQQGEPSITMGEVTDARGHAMYWLAAIRGGYGNPLKVLMTEQHVSVVVRQALSDALAARNLQAENGRHRLVVRLVRFDGNQLFPKEAHIVLAVRLEDAATNAVLYEGEARADGAGAGIGGGIFTPIEPLRALINDVMNQGIDRALDDPAFRAALAGASEAQPVAAEAPSEATPAPETPVLAETPEAPVTPETAEQ
jgi:hypothetical protein